MPALLLATAAPSNAYAAALCRFELEGRDTGIAYNLSTGAAPNEVRVGVVTTAPKLSADRRRVYIPTDAGLEVLQLQSLRVSDVVPVTVDGSWVVAPDDRVYFVDPDAPAVVRALDVRRRAAVDVVALPDGTRYAGSMSIGGGGRLLFVTAIENADTPAVSIAAVDLVERRILATWTSPHQWPDLDVDASPSGEFAYVTERAWYGDEYRAQVLAWRIGTEPEPLEFAPGQIIFSQDGGRAYIEHGWTLDGPDPTVVVDTETHRSIATLPEGEIIGFADAGCVMLADQRVLRHACPGDSRSQIVDRATLSPDDTTLVDSNTFGAPGWTDGPCGLPPAGCANGIACLEILGADGLAGESVEIGVRLHTAGGEIAGVLNDLFVDPGLSISIAPAGSDGRPASRCRINPNIGKDTSVVGCHERDGPECHASRALVVSLLDVDPIADDSLLYTCDVRIADDAAAGRYRLGCVNAEAADSAGNDVPIDCRDGEIVVAAPGAGALHAGSGAAAANGCQITSAEGGSAASAWLLGLVALFVARRRRPR